MSNLLARTFVPFCSSFKASFLNCSAACIVLPTRNTFILKRRWPPGLTKRGRQPVLRGRHYVYDLVENTNLRKRKNIDIILTTYVAGLGDEGDRISINSNYAYYNLLLLGKAVYAIPENESDFKELEGISERRETKFSSPTAERTMRILSQFKLSVVMNKEQKWELQPWHVRASFRKAGIVVPESAIEMPSQPIRGPDLNLEGKEFFVHVTINGRERVAVSCRLHHWSTELAERLPFVENFWELPTAPLFPEKESGAPS